MSISRKKKTREEKSILFFHLDLYKSFEVRSQERKNIITKILPLLQIYDNLWDRRKIKDFFNGHSLDNEAEEDSIEYPSILYHDNLEYRFNSLYCRKNNKRISYRCQNRNCTGRIIYCINGQENKIEISQDHIKDCSITGNKYTNKIYENFLKVIKKGEKFFSKKNNIGPAEIHHKMLKYSMKYPIIERPIISRYDANKIFKGKQTIHQKLIIDSNLPKEIIFPKGKNFVLFQSVIPYKIIMFSTPQMLKCALAGNVLFMDGTFRSTPKEFNMGQLLNVGVYVPQNNSFIQVFHILMQSRNEEIYSFVFSILSNYIDFKKMTQIMIDFETPLISGLEKYVSHNVLTGCLFHFRQSLRRNFKKIYPNPDDFQKKYYRLFLDFPFAENKLVQKITSYFIQRKYLNFIDFTNYFINTYMKNSKYEIYNFSKWNSSFQTNDSMESFHSILRSKIPQKHPSVNNLSLILYEHSENQINKLSENVRDDSLSTRSVFTRVTSQQIENNFLTLINQDPSYEIHHQVHRTEPFFDLKMVSIKKSNSFLANAKKQRIAKLLEIEKFE